MWLHREATSSIMYQLSTMLFPCTELSLSLLATLCIEVLQLQFQVTNPLKLKSLDWRALPLTLFLNIVRMCCCLLSCTTVSLALTFLYCWLRCVLEWKSHRRVLQGFLCIITDLGSMETLRNCAIIKMTPAAIASDYEGIWNTIIKWHQP